MDLLVRQKHTLLLESKVYPAFLLAQHEQWNWEVQKQFQWDAVGEMQFFSYHQYTLHNKANSWT